MNNIISVFQRTPQAPSVAEEGQKIVINVNQKLTSQDARRIGSWMIGKIVRHIAKENVGVVEGRLYSAALYAFDKSTSRLSKKEKDTTAKRIAKLAAPAIAQGLAVTIEAFGKTLFEITIDRANLPTK